MDGLFIELGVVTVVAAAMAILARFLKQPVVLAYLLTGVVLGSGGFQVIPNNQITEDIAAIGIIFLLYLVGLELDIKRIRKLGGVVLVAGIAQMLVTMGAVYGATVLMGYPVTTGVYLGLAAAFSSTAVVLKMLADKHQLSSLHARITIGILLFQDVVAILALIVISGVDHGNFDPWVLGSYVLRGSALLFGVWFVTRYVLSRLFFHIAKSSELLFSASVAWAFLFAMISGELGFSREIGAFLAGVSLATLPYNLEIISRVKPLKDFFLVIFFVVLGLEVSWQVVLQNFWLIAVIAAIVLFVKSIVASLTVVRMGYPKRPAYLTGTHLGQMSEFSLVVVLLGASYGHVGSDVVAVVASLLVVTIALNTYWNSLNKYLYKALVKPLEWIATTRHKPELHFRPERMQGHAVLFGANRTGYQMLKKLEELGDDVLVVDHNPEVIKRLLHRGVPSVYGDLDDFELLKELDLDAASMIISTVPHVPSNVYLIEHTRTHNEKALIIAVAEQVEDALALYAAGADYVVVPRLVGGEQAAELLERVETHQTTPRDLRKRREQHIDRLKSRAKELVTA